MFSLSFEIGNLFAFYMASYIVSEGEIVEYKLCPS